MNWGWSFDNWETRMDRQPLEDLRTSFDLNGGRLSVGWQLSPDVDDDSGSVVDGSSIDIILCDTILKQGRAVL